MKKINDKVAIGECYGLGQTLIEAIVAYYGDKVTMSENLGGTNNHRRFVITGDHIDEIVRDLIKAETV